MPSAWISRYLLFISFYGATGGIPNLISSRQSEMIIARLTQMPDKAEVLMWRQRAEHYRALAADPAVNQVSRNMLLALAREADAVAQDIEDRLNGDAT